MARVPDESDFRSRPGKRGSRPRTKQRPEHADAVTGFVTGVDRGRYTLLVGGTDDGTVVGAEDERTVLAMKARELGRTRIVCGDRVDLVGDVTGDDGSLARIVRIQERSSVLRRTADDTDPYERVIVANADQLVVVTALAEPEPRTRMIDRCVVAAYDAGMDVLLCLTKADLADPAPLRALYEPLGVSVVVTRRAPDGLAPDGWAIEPLDAVREALAGRTSVFVGHSGVGKSDAPSTRSCPTPGARRGTSTTSRGAAGTRRRRRSRCACRAAGGSSTPRACGRSGSRTCRSTTCCARSRTSTPSPPRARAGAPTSTTRRTARSTTGWRTRPTTPPATPARRGSSRSGACSPRAPAPPEPAPRAAPPPARARTATV